MSKPLSIVEIEFFVDDLRAVVPLLTGDFHRIFHDPFAPPQAPHLWSVELFEHYARLLRANKGYLLTYSGAAAVRGGLRETGFSLLKTMGIGGKVGGTAAFADGLPPLQQWENLCRPLDEWEQAYLESRAGIPYRDPHLNATFEEVVRQREEEQRQSSRPSGRAFRPDYFSKLFPHAARQD